MKKIIQIEIEYPDCDMLNPTDSLLNELELEAMNIFGIVEEVKDGRWKILTKEVKPINEKELDRIDIVNMLRGTTPCYSIMMDIPKELGSYCGGFVDEWKWNISAYNIEYFKNYSDEYLLELYYKCKNGLRNN